MTACDVELNALLRRWLFAGSALVVALGLGWVGRGYAAAGGGTLVCWCPRLGRAAQGREPAEAPFNRLRTGLPLTFADDHR
jgi:hypothetical protein